MQSVNANYTDILFRYEFHCAYCTMKWRIIDIKEKNACKFMKKTQPTRFGCVFFPLLYGFFA